MEPYEDTQALFAQLGASPFEGGVKVLIENHDAWTHNSSSLVALNAAAQARVAAAVQYPATTRIQSQRNRLRGLVTCLPKSYARAG